MAIFRRRTLLRHIDAESVKAAIAAAERRTSGEIRVSLAPFFWGDIQKTAQKAFDRMGMTATRDRNGILFFIVPARHRFAVIGDSGIHEKVGAEFWQHVIEAVSAHFRRGDFTAGLVQGIQEVGARLAEHFPFDPHTDKNELPDDIDLSGRRG